MSTARFVVGLLSASVFLCMSVWCGVALYMAYKKIEMLLHLFPKSVGVKTLTPLRHAGIWGKLMLIGGITGYVAFPRLYLKNGQLSSEDLQAIPNSLRLKLAIMHWLLVTLVLAMLALCFISKSGLFY
jgi:hypothetical protein